MIDQEFIDYLEQYKEDLLERQSKYPNDGEHALLRGVYDYGLLVLSHVRMRYNTIYDN